MFDTWTTLFFKHKAPADNFRKQAALANQQGPTVPSWKERRMSLSWLHLSCSFLVEDTSEVVLDLNSCGFSLIQYPVLEKACLLLEKAEGK